MPERVDFYIINSDQALDRLICACKIANKAYTQGLKVYMQTDTITDLDTLDRLLWSYKDTSFIPHQKVEAGINTKSKQVLIGKGPMPEELSTVWDELLISLTKIVPTDADYFHRIADLISANTDSKQQGRARFKHYRSLGIEPTTHQINT